MRQSLILSLYRDSVPRFFGGLFLLSAAFFIIGCAPKSFPTLNDGYAALEQHQYDQAIAGADEFLTQHPQGPGTAEAFYLRGRALEQRPAGNPGEATNNLQDARRAYLAALDHSPSLALAGYIHASLSNVAYFLDDFAFALPQAVEAYELTKSPDLRSQLLLRIGQSQLRLSRFTDADRTFADLLQKFPAGNAAREAKSLQGVRQFFVQVGTYSKASNADATAAAIQAAKAPVDRQTDAEKRIVVRIGPLPSYAEARQMKERFARMFPDALIVP